MAKDSRKNKFSELRLRAEAYLRSGPDRGDMSQEDVQKLVHELDTYQIELELQNEDLRNAQEGLDRSRRRYTDLYDFAPVAYLTINETGMIVEANLLAGELFGVPRGQLLNRLFSSFLFAEDQDLFYLHRKKLMETGRQQSCELRLQKIDGSSFYALVEISHQRKGDDLPGQFLVTVNDISVRKRAELAKVQRLKDRYQAIVMDQSDLVCRFDPQGRITFVNDAYCQYFAVNHKDILGTRFLPPIHEEDLSIVKDQFKTLTRLKPDKTIEYRVYSPDGNINWQQWSARALYSQEGELQEYQVVGRDITAMKEAEEKMRGEVRLRQLFLDALPCIAMLLKYGSRRIVAANRAAIAVGAAPGEKCYAAWAQRDRPCSWCLAPRLWAENESQNDQFWALGKYWDAYWVPVGERLYLHYVFDITEKHLGEEALKHAYDEMEQRVMERTLELQQSHAQLLHSEKLAAVGNLSASIAHEFNNPLQSVSTILKGLEQYASLDEKEAELVTLALEECQRMKSLIANLRDFFQPSSGSLGLVDLHATLDALLLMSKKDFHIRKISVVKKYGDNIPQIMAVADQLKQVFLNLLNNAADACEDGGVITLTTKASGTSDIAIHIADDGVGIDSINMAHIFEPFFTTKPAVKGTGLGLSVSYGIVKKHGGRIEVKSERGRGSTFSVYLPVEGGINEQ
jgi:PAS domain S-box-containing protein